MFVILQITIYKYDFLQLRYFHVNFMFVHYYYQPFVCYFKFSKYFSYILWIYKKGKYEHWYTIL